MDPVLQELRSQWDAKRSQVEMATARFEQLALSDPEAAQIELAKSDQAVKDASDLERKMLEYQEARQREQEIRQKMEKSIKTITQRGGRPLPFSVGDGVTVDQDPLVFRKMDGTAAEPSTRREFTRFACDVKASNGRQHIAFGDSELDKKAPTGGFKSLGHFAWCVTRRGRDGRGDPHAVDMLKDWQYLQVKAPQGMFEESDPDGGDLIPREFSNNIYERMMATNQILPYLQGLPLAGNTLTVPALKEDSRADGSRHGGVLGYWEGEADQYAKTSPKFRNINLKLHKLTVLTYVTEELLMDSAVALEAYLGRLVPREVNFKINDALINGLGSGMPQGILKANSKVTTTAVSSQGAGTIVYQNITDMWRNAIGSQRSSAIWLYNQDCESALYRMYMATGTAAGVAVYTPNEPTEFKFMGRPALVMEQCATLGTEGDLILFCPEGWATIIKGGLQSFMSMHLRFDYDEFAYKWRFRMDAQPYDDVALSAFKGSAKYSSVVTLSSTRT